MIAKARITGIGAYAPETIVTNDMLADVVVTSDEWIRSRTGIAERRISTGEGTTDLAVKASLKALENAQVNPEDIDLIILATSSPDRNFPSGACEVQAAIGAHHAAAFDISAACSGFIFAMHIVQGFFASGMYQKALIIGSETLSKITDWTDRGSCILFGDGAGAAVLEAGDTGILDMIIGSDGRKGEILSCESRTFGNFLTGKKPESAFMTMDGQEVFRFAVKTVPESILKLMERNHLTGDEIPYFILHQANERIIEAVARRLKQPMEKFPMCISRYGNTSSASIPILLAEMNEKHMLKPGDKVILSGFGAGMTWGAVLLEWQP